MNVSPGTRIVPLRRARIVSDGFLAGLGIFLSTIAVVMLGVWLWRTFA